MDTNNGYLLKQRAFLKLHMITLTEQERLYGLKIQDYLFEEYKNYGYRPTHSEIYKALHELVEDNILEQVKRVKEGTVRQTVVFYRFRDLEHAKAYKKLLKDELDRSINMLRKTLKLNYS